MKIKLIVFTIILKILFLSSINGQIVIQETIHLNDFSLLKSNQENHLVTCTISGSNPDKEFKILCGEQWGNPVTLANVQPGGTTFYIRESTGHGEANEVSYEVKFDGRIIKQGTVPYFNGGNYNLHVAFPIQKGFIFRIPEMMGGYVDLSLALPRISSQQWIEEGKTFDIDLHNVTLSILEGGEYFEYFDSRKNISYGNSIEKSFKDPDLFDVDIVQKENINSSDPIRLIIKAECNGLEIRDTGYVYPDDSFIEVSFDKEFLYEGDSTYIILKEKDFYGDEFYLNYWFYNPLSIKVDSSINAFLYNYKTSDTATYFENINNEIELVARNNIADDTVLVKVLVEAKYDDSIIIGKVTNNQQELKVKKAVGFIKIIKKIKNYVIPSFDEPITSGNTYTLKLEKQKGDNELMPFSSDQLFEIGIAEGCEFAKILTKDNLIGEYFDSLKQPIRIIIDEEITTDSLELKLEIGVIDDSIKYYPKPVTDKNTNEQSNPLKKLSDLPNICENYNFNLNLFATLQDEVEVPIEIMLGETKYFQLLKSPKTTEGEFEYKIKEVTKFDSTGKPLFDSLAVKEDVWGNDPIEVVSGGKSGIFFDKFIAQIAAAGTKTKPVMIDLENGLIRVIGKYWEKGKEYKIKLVAKNKSSDEYDSQSIKVIRPDKLGSKYNRIYDFPDKSGNLKEWNLDSLIIDYAGKEGIMPQIVKGIIRKESIIKKGTSKIKPSYRYEVFADGYGALRKRGFDSTSIYWVKSKTDLGNPTIPDHGEVWLGSSTSIPKYFGYYNAWEFLKKYKHLYYYLWKEIDNSYTDTSLVGVCLSTYKTQNNKIAYFRKIYENRLKGKIKDKDSLVDSIRTLIHKNYELYLKDSINTYGNGGLSDIICQTRLCSSYGLMQLTYYNGTGRLKIKDNYYGYPKNNKDYLPEYINVPDINLKYGIYHLLYKIRQKSVLGSITFPTDKTWPKNFGFEISYWKALRYYNNNEKYPNSVFAFTKLYQPVKK